MVQWSKATEIEKKPGDYCCQHVQKINIFDYNPMALSHRDIQLVRFNSDFTLE